MDFAIIPWGHYSQRYSSFRHHEDFVRTVISFRYFSRISSSMLASSMRSGSQRSSIRFISAVALGPIPFTTSSHIARTLTTSTQGENEITVRTECDFITALWVATTLTGECVFAFALGERARGSLEHVKIAPMPISPGSVLAESGLSSQARRTHESERCSSESRSLKPYANN